MSRHPDVPVPPPISVPDRNTAAPVRVVVIGAGYAGVIAANRLLATASRTPGRKVQVTVVNPRPDFVPRIRLHEFAAGSTASASLPMSEVLHSAARVLVGEATRIDPTDRTVHGTDWTLDYDYLIYAVGSVAAQTVPGATTVLYPVATLESADRLRTAVVRLSPGGVVAIVGGGLTGVETAAEIAERHPELRIRLFASQPVAAGLGPRARRRVLSTLGALGVEVRQDHEVVDLREGRLLFRDGTSQTFDVGVWAGPMTAPGLARVSGLPVDDSGRLLVDETLRCPEYPRIVGAGDAVAPPSTVAGHLRPSCAAALPLGVHAADTVLAMLTPGGARTPSPISVGFVVQGVSLGRARGIAQLVRPDDSPRPISVGGRAGAWAKEQICRYTIRTVQAERDRTKS